MDPRLGWPNQDTGVVEGRRGQEDLGEGEDRSGEPVGAQLGRLAAQLQGLQEQLEAFTARRSQAVAEQASRHVAAIVAAAEEAAAEIRGNAEHDAAALRDRLLADVQAEVERIRADAQADAARIRTEAHAEVARMREPAIAQATAEIDAFVARLAGDLQVTARAAIARATGSTAPGGPSAAGAQPTAQAPADEHHIAEEVAEAVDELQDAASALEESLRHLRAIGDEKPPLG